MIFFETTGFDIMADYETVLTQCFPNIDSEIVHYVNGKKWDLLHIQVYDQRVFYPQES